MRIELEAARYHGRDVARGAELQVVAAEELVTQARSVQHQVVDGDAALRRAKPGLAVGAEAVEHLQLVDLRRVAAGIIIEREFAFLHQLHHQGAG